MSDGCVEVRGRDSELSEGVDLVAARRLTRSMSKAIKVCLHLFYFDLWERILRRVGRVRRICSVADKDAASLTVGRGGSAAGIFLPLIGSCVRSMTQSEK
jgi:hypothetical protein